MLVALPNSDSHAVLVHLASPQGGGDAPAPARRPDVPSPTSTTTQTPDGPKSTPPAQSDFGMWPMLIGFIAIFYFLILRPSQKQEKQRKALLSSIKRGDRVVTTGGVHGEIASLTDTTVELRVAADVTMTFDRAAVAKVLSADDAAKGTAGAGGA